MTPMFSLFLASLFLLPSDLASTPAKHQPLPSLTGPWTVVGMSDNSDLAGAVLTFASRRVRIKFASGEIEYFDYRVSHLTRPTNHLPPKTHAFDLITKRHGDVPGLLLMMGKDRAIIAIGESTSSGRPKTFRPKPGNEFIVLALQRQSASVTTDPNATMSLPLRKPDNAKGGKL